MIIFLRRFSVSFISGSCGKRRNLNLSWGRYLHHSGISVGEHSSQRWLSCQIYNRRDFWAFIHWATSRRGVPRQKWLPPGCTCGGEGNQSWHWGGWPIISLRWSKGNGEYNPKTQTSEFAGQDDVSCFRVLLGVGCLVKDRGKKQDYIPAHLVVFRIVGFYVM